MSSGPSSRKASEKQDDSARIAVQWDDGELANPFNWTPGYKSWLTFQLSLIALAASVGSSIISPANAAIAAEFSISEELAVLNVSLYVLGFALGPLCWAGISELYGRRVSIIPPMVCLGLFSIGVATSQNAQSIFICRFFSGLFGSAPVSNVNAAFGDFWTAKPRGTAVALYAVAVVGGPTLGPTIGAAITVTPGMGWRWVSYILAIWVFATTALLLFCLPEVYGPLLLKKKAQRLRRETGCELYYHPIEDAKVDVKSLLTKHLSRPLRMLFTEPMVACMAVYASFVYSLLYMTLEVFPIVFEQERGWSLVVSTLPFLGLFVGVLGALVINLTNQKRYARIVEENGGGPQPEARLAPMIIGGVLFAAGLFWFGWTSNPAILWVSPVFAAAFIGAGFNTIFQQAINYLVDAYRVYAASAVSANTILRSLLACGLPLAVRPMFNALGVGPAMSILGGVAVLALPVPFIFIKYGKSLREKSSFAPGT